MRPLCDLLFAVPSDDTPLIQQVTMVAAHAMCELVERDLTC
jgi:D-sedoheptulose 7-phosphate isomerase